MTRLRVSRLGKDPSHRKHMFRTMTTQLFKHERIKTTLPKAMALRSHAERMITLAKNNTYLNHYSFPECIKDYRWISQRERCCTQTSCSFEVALLV